MKRLFALSALASLLLAACKPAGSGDTLKLGFIGPLTGEAASYGTDALNGAKLAVDEINANGGVNEKIIKIIAEDGRCTGTDAAGAAQKLVNIDKVSVILTGCSGETLAVAPIAEQANVVVFSPVSSSPDVTTAGEYVFRNYPSDALKTKATAQFFREKRYQRIALISENTDFAQAFRTALQKDVGTAAFVFDEIVEPSTKDFRSLLTRLKKGTFDVFFPNAQSDAVAAAMVQQFREQGFTQPIVSHDVADSLTLAEIAREAVEGMVVINVPAAGEGGAFETMFVEKYGAPQSTLAFAAHAYDATKLLLQAFADGATDGPALKKYLDNLESYEGIIGTFSFDANGDVIGVPYVVKKFQEGKIVEVEKIRLEE